MSPRFIPSGSLALYTARLWIVRTLAVLAMLVLVLMSLDLLGESGRILEPEGNGQAELLRYVGYRVPQLVARFLPFAVLLGTLITFIGLSQGSEVIAMKAAGISAHQILTPFLLAGVVVAGLSFAFNERVVTRATRALNAWEAVDYGPLPPRATGGSNVWVRSGDNLVRAETVSGTGPGLVLGGVTLFGRDRGVLRTVTEAERAVPVARGWRLEGVRTFDVAAGRVTRQAAGTLSSSLRPEQFTLAAVEADEQPWSRLRQAIAALRDAGRPTEALESGMWHKISGPAAAALMPLLAAVAAFGLARSGRLFVRAIIGMGLGFAFFVVDNFALALGNLGAYSPALAAWGPLLLFGLIGEAVLLRTEE